MRSADTTRIRIRNNAISSKGGMLDERSSTLFEIERRQFLDSALLVHGRVDRIQFDDAWEYPFSVRRRFLREIRPDFGKIEAFGIWRDREESDEDLLTKLGAQWGASGDSD
jgi:hypothetical protein